MSTSQISKASNYTEEYVAINGISQYFLHCPAAGGEVMLVVHGGPGQSEAHLAYLDANETSGFTAVYYDQRGTGKTLNRNRTKASEITFEQLYLDLCATVAYLKQKYLKDRIILSGHSWGSLLGLTYASEHPENLLCYIGCGQVVEMRAGERLMLGKLRELAVSRQDGKSLRLLDSLGDYPYAETNVAQLLKTTAALMKVKGRLGVGLDTRKLQKIVSRSPVFRVTDLFAMLRARKLSAHLYQALIDFSASEMRTFDTPVCFIHGDNDWQIPIELAKSYLANITAPTKGFFTVENAGHIINIDNPKGTMDALSECIRQALQRHS